jgi:hypothetical protein
VKDYIRGLTEQVEQTENYEVYSKALIDVIIRQTYQRLDAITQQTFCQLGVFLDGFDQTAAAALADTHGSDPEIL